MACMQRRFSFFFFWIDQMYSCIHWGKSCNQSSTKSPLSTCSHAEDLRFGKSVVQQLSHCMRRSRWGLAAGRDGKSSVHKITLKFLFSKDPHAWKHNAFGWIIYRCCILYVLWQMSLLHASTPFPARKSKHSLDWLWWPFWPNLSYKFAQSKVSIAHMEALERLDLLTGNFALFQGHKWVQDDTVDASCIHQGVEMLETTRHCHGWPWEVQPRHINCACRQFEDWAGSSCCFIFCWQIKQICASFWNTESGHDEGKELFRGEVTRPFNVCIQQCRK